MDERKVNIRVYLVRDFMFFGVQTNFVAHTGAKKFKWEQFCFEITQPFRISPIKTGKHQLCFLFLIQHHNFKNFAGLWAINFVWTIEEI